MLAQADIEVVGRLPYSSNGTFLVRCARGRERALAVYKPAAGETPLWDFPSETLHRREVAAYELSRWLGWHIVPPTILRTDAPLGPGALQHYVEHDPEQHFFTLLRDHRRDFRRLAFFDILTNNADRKAGHCLLDRAGRVWAIDHGLTFHVEPKLRTVIWDFAGQALPARERAAAMRVAGALEEPGSELPRVLGSLLDSAELEALSRRAKTLSSKGTFPGPSSSWAFPWPLV
jgi:hypothetical protein